MMVIVKLFATLKKYGPTNIGIGETFSVNLEEDADIATLLRKLKIPKVDAKIIMINGKNSEIGDKPRDGDTIAIFPPVGGGSSP